MSQMSRTSTAKARRIPAGTVPTAETVAETGAVIVAAVVDAAAAVDEAEGDVTEEAVVAGTVVVMVATAVVGIKTSHEFLRINTG